MDATRRVTRTEACSITEGRAVAILRTEAALADANTNGVPDECE